MHQPRIRPAFRCLRPAREACPGSALGGHPNCSIRIHGALTAHSRRQVHLQSAPRYAARHRSCCRCPRGRRPSGPLMRPPTPVALLLEDERTVHLGPAGAFVDAAAAGVGELVADLSVLQHTDVVDQPICSLTPITAVDVDLDRALDALALNDSGSSAAMPPMAELAMAARAAPRTFSRVTEGVVMRFLPAFLNAGLGRPAWALPA